MVIYDLFVLYELTTQYEMVKEMLFKTKCSLLIVVLLIGCKPPGTSNDGSISCPEPARMSDGEIVTYAFTYSNGNTITHTITKMPDGDESGKIHYSISDGREFNYSLKNLCSSRAIPLSNEEVFLFLDGALTGKIVENDPLNTNSKSPVEFIETVCNDILITLPAGEFPARMCTYVSKDDTETFSKSIHINQNNSTPLLGLLQYHWTNHQQEITVELIEWNGI
jgi:hypothetical protein